LAANTAYVLEFFSNPASDGQGQTYVVTLTVTTDAAGNATFSVNLSGKISVGPYLTATATDPAGNTSEFSNDQVVSQEDFCSENRTLQPISRHKLG
jgi:hypothetical protein